VGDVNGDGRLDLAVANYGGPPSFNDSNVSVLLGNGDGSFQPARNFAAGLLPVFLAAGDVNGDGLPDLAVAHGDGTVSVLLGNGDGSFQPARNFGAGGYRGSVAIGDVNGDGVSDLAVASLESANVCVLLGNGDGSFLTATHFAAGTG